MKPQNKYTFLIGMIFILLFCFGPDTISQINNSWYFGQNAGISFNTGIPSSKSDGALNTPEGCASVSNASGNILFYTNGVTVYDWTHNIMQNGTGLNGNLNASQSVVIVNKPISSSTYFVFTVDADAGHKGLSYSVIDVGLNLKKGSVIKKNIKLLDNVTEKLTTAKHCNGKDFWVICHQWNSNKFYAYLVTKDGVDTIPVISSAGSVHTGNIGNVGGCMKIDNKSQKLALVVTSAGFLELFSFDALTGKVSNPIKIENLEYPYGVEFTDVGNMVYVSGITGKLYQFNTFNWNKPSIESSRYIVAYSSNLLGSLQIGPNEKIYLSADMHTYLGVINSPENSGSACSYDPNGLYLNGRKCEAGLPQRVLDSRDFALSITEVCFGDTSAFSVVGELFRLDSVLWVFGDNTVAPHDTSTLLNPKYKYPFLKNYSVTLFVFYCETVDTIRGVAVVKGPPVVYLGPDTIICEKPVYELKPGSGDTYQWQNGSTASSFIVNQPGIYWVIVGNVCGITIDSVEISAIYPSPILFLGSDTSICEGDSIFLDAGGCILTYLWHNQDTNRYFTAKDSGNYWVKVTNAFGCSSSDDFTLSLLFKPKPDLGNDTTICFGESVTFNGGAPGQTYLWNDGSFFHHFIANKSGHYFVTVSNICGSGMDSVKLEVESCETILWAPNAFSPDDNGINDRFFISCLNVSQFELYIFNRYGEIIYQSKDYYEGWDGTFKNQMCKNDLYVWKVVYKGLDNKEYTKFGNVFLIR